MSGEPPPIAWPPQSPLRMTVQLVAHVVPAVVVVIVVIYAGTQWAGLPLLAAAHLALALGAASLFYVSRSLPRWERAPAARRIARGEPPWRAERRWNPRGARTHSVARYVGAFAWTVFLAVLPCTGGIVRIGGLAWLGTALMLVVTIAAVRAWLRGRVHVRWNDVPVRVGTRARFVLSMTPGSTALADVAVRLRCVCTSELTLVSNPTPVVMRRIEPLPGAPTALDADGEAIFEFDIPADAEGTNLRGPAPTHWELAVWGRTGWGEFADSVPVPVYAET